MVIQLLRSLYDHNIPVQQQGEVYEHILKEIELFSISPQVYQLLQNTDSLEQVPPFFAERLKQHFKRGLVHNLFMKRVEDDVLRCFEQWRMEVIPLKGTRFAQRYFGHVAARVTSDVDLLVQADMLDTAIQRLVSIGFEFEIIKDHHARLMKNGMMVELHWTLDKQHWSDLDAAPFWREAQPAEGFSYVKQLSDLHSFYFICLHGARHQMDSIRYVLDVAQVLYRHGDRIDLQALLDQAAADKTAKRLQAVLSIVYQVFPRLHTRYPLPFEPIETHWSYDTLKNARHGTRTKKYYLYKLFFRHFIYDTFKHQMKSIHKPY
ncbi:nucleotidyltransferase family protein [Paenibacillus sp. y28]|uniref:nucleotidyltransferase family protein n=1 Tax=Paenibacillus sp. y28 TaxID=3129110 RepID=UPI003018D221